MSDPVAVRDALACLRGQATDYPRCSHYLDYTSCRNATALLHSAAASALAELDRCRAALDAAKALEARLQEVADDPRYQAVWTLAHGHYGDYRGKRYDAELDALRAALEAVRS